MIGVMYITQARMPFVVEDASHWVFTNTGLKNGDTLVNPRRDATSSATKWTPSARGHRPASNAPRTRRRTPAAPTSPTSTVYRAASGATVFAFRIDPVDLRRPPDRAGDEERAGAAHRQRVSRRPPDRPPLPAPLQAADIGDVGRPGFVSAASADRFTLNGAGQDAGRRADALHYVYQA